MMNVDILSHFIMAGVINLIFGSPYVPRAILNLRNSVTHCVFTPRIW